MCKLRQRLSLRRVQSSTSVEFILSSCLLRIILHSRTNHVAGYVFLYCKIVFLCGTNAAGNFQLDVTLAVLLETVFSLCVTHTSPHRLQVSHIDLHNRCNGQCANDSARCMQPAKQPDGKSLDTALAYSEGIVQGIVEIFIVLYYYVGRSLRPVGVSLV